MSASSQRLFPPTQDILGDFKAFLQKLENISWVKTVANTTGNFNKFASDISDLSEHEHEIYYLLTSSLNYKKILNMCFNIYFDYFLKHSVGLGITYCGLDAFRTLRLQTSNVKYPNK